MQTFLPYPSFTESAAVLDRRRLGKQRVENLQILQVLTGNRLVSTASGWHLEARVSGGWSHHPAVLMWSGYLPALLSYQEATCWEWTSRGYQDTCWQKSEFLVLTSGYSRVPMTMPAWIGSERFHAAHRGTLLAKDPEWYERFGWTDGPDPDGLWPIATRPSSTV